MKAKLLVAALAAAFSMGVQAQTSVTFYGIIDSGLGYVNTGGTDPATKAASKGTTIMVNGGLNSSIYGFRGVEDLGGGLRALFNLEGQFSASNGAVVGNFWSRRSFVGVSGDWGQLTLGRDWTPAFWMGVHQELNSYTLLGNSLAFWTGNGTRSNNGIFYNTPTINGFMARTMISTGDWDGTGSGERNEGKYLSLGLQYVPDPLEGISASVYYNHRTGGPLAASGSVALFGGKALASDDFGIGGGYKWSRVRVAGGYNQIKPVDNLAPKQEMATIGVGVKVFAQDEISLEYIQLRRSATTGTEPRANIFSASYVYPLSKRTRLYVSAAKANNNETGTFSLTSAAQAFTPLSPGGDPRGVLFGITHTF
jgi:predicted porin